MRINVNKDKVEILENENEGHEGEYLITKCYFTFDDFIDSFYVKRAIFKILSTEELYEIDIINNECDIPYEVLKHAFEKVKLGVYAYDIDNNDKLVRRASPSHAIFSVPTGSYEDGAVGPKEITPTQYDIYSERLQEGLDAVDDKIAEMDIAIAGVENLDIDAEKEGTKTTVTITKKDGTQEEVEILDGVSLENMEIQNRDLLVTYGGNTNDLGQIEPNVQVGTTTTIAPSLNARVENVGTTLNPVFNFYIPKGEAGSIKFDIVEQLPTEDIELDTIYLVPYAKVTVQELPTENIQANTIYIVSGTGKRYIYQSNQWIEIASDNQYLEYIYVNNQWEELGSIGVDIDLTDYYTKSETNSLLSGKVGFTDYATSSTGGVFKIGGYGSALNSAGQLYILTQDYATYQAQENGYMIGKGTLENVITGKGLVSNTDYATDSASGVLKTNFSNSFSVNPSNGVPYCDGKTYEQYGSAGNGMFIGKQTLENVITGKGLIDNNYLATSSTPGLVYANNNINYGNIGVNQYGMLFLSTTTGNTLQSAIESNTRSIPILSGNFREACGYLDLTTKSYVDGLVGNLESILETLDIGTGV